MTLVVYFRNSPGMALVVFCNDTRIFQEGYCPGITTKKGALGSAP